MNLDKQFKALCSKWALGSSTTVREMMKSTGAIITGSVALELLHPGKFAPGDLDFFVLECGVDALTRFIVKAGYDLTNKPPHPDSYEADIWGDGYCQFKVLDLFHRGLDPIMKINIVVPHETNLVEAVTRFHSTVVMNFVSYYGHLCLYPEWTNDYIGAVVRNRESDIAGIMKYRLRGYSLFDVPSDILNIPAIHECEELARCPTQPRTLYASSAFIPFKGLNKNLSRFVSDFEWALPYACKNSISALPNSFEDYAGLD